MAASKKLTVEVIENPGDSEPYLPTGGSIERIVTLIDAAHSAKQSPILWGDVGVGKTAVIHEIAKRSDCSGMAKLSLNSMERTDMLGLPDKVEVDGVTYTDYADPRWVQRANATPEGKYFYLVVDELTTADPDMQNTLLVPIQNREVASGTRLNDNVRVIFAANPSWLVDTVYDLNAPLANRLFHIDFEVSTAEWIAGFLVGWGKPMTDTEAALRRAFAVFLSQHPTLIQHKQSQDGKAGGSADGMDRGGDNPKVDRAHAWPSRRSWDNAASVAAQLPTKALDFLRDDVQVDRTDTGLLESVVSGYVGKSPSAAFRAFLSGFRLPTPDEIVAHPERGVDWSDWVSASIALQSVIAWVRDEATAKLAADVFTHAASVTEYKDTATLLVQKFMDRCADLGVSALPDIGAFSGFTDLVT